MADRARSARPADLIDAALDQQQPRATWCGCARVRVDDDLDRFLSRRAGRFPYRLIIGSLCMCRGAGSPKGEKLRPLAGCRPIGRVVYSWLSPEGRGGDVTSPRAFWVSADCLFIPAGDTCEASTVTAGARVYVDQAVYVEDGGGGWKERAAESHTRALACGLSWAQACDIHDTVMANKKDR